MRRSLDRLRRHGIVWADVQPDNISTDKNGKPCLIDFGGGFNCAYVDEDVTETVDGDMQGDSRIMKVPY
jgi:Ser/Thr protein kinase RdoA (MazF antagonist)